MTAISSDFGSSVAHEKQNLHALCSAIEQEGNGLILLTKTDFEANISKLILSAPQAPEAGSVSIVINTAADGTRIKCRGAAASCHTYDDTIDMVTRWAAGFLTGDAKQRVLALNPSYEAPASVIPAETIIKEIVFNCRPRQQPVPA